MSTLTEIEYEEVTYRFVTNDIIINHMSGPFFKVYVPFNDDVISSDDWVLDSREQWSEYIILDYFM